MNLELAEQKSRKSPGLFAECFCRHTKGAQAACDFRAKIGSVWKRHDLPCIVAHDKAFASDLQADFFKAEPPFRYRDREPNQPPNPGVKRVVEAGEFP